MNSELSTELSCVTERFCPDPPQRGQRIGIKHPGLQIEIFGGNGMKKITPWLIASAVIMFAFPWLAVTFIKGDAAMAVCFILFFVVNPIYAICAGAYAGKDLKKFWILPIITALFFLAGTWIFFDMGEKAFILYAFVYLLLGIVSMLIPMFLKKH